jgi:hypothetical protein
VRIEPGELAAVLRDPEDSVVESEMQSAVRGPGGLPERPEVVGAFFASLELLARLASTVKHFKETLIPMSKVL